MKRILIKTLLILGLLAACNSTSKDTAPNKPEDVTDKPPISIPPVSRTPVSKPLELTEEEEDALVDRFDLSGQWNYVALVTEPDCDSAVVDGVCTGNKIVDSCNKKRYEGSIFIPTDVTGGIENAYLEGETVDPYGKECIKTHSKYAYPEFNGMKSKYTLVEFITASQVKSSAEYENTLTIMTYERDLIIIERTYLNVYKVFIKLTKVM